MQAMRKLMATLLLLLCLVAVAVAQTRGRSTDALLPIVKGSVVVSRVPFSQERLEGHNSRRVLRGTARGSYGCRKRGVKQLLKLVRDDAYDLTVGGEFRGIKR